MTNRTERATNRPAARTGRRAALLLPVGIIAGMVAISMPGCGGDDEQAQAPERPQRPAPREEKPDPFEGLAKDPRVEFPRSREPATPAQAQAVADLASAIARGDEKRLRELLDTPAEAVLDTLISDGVWGDATGGIETVRVVALEGPEVDTRVGLAIQDPRGAYVLGWAGSPAGAGAWQWTGLAIEAPSAARASELDGIALAEAGIPTPGAEEDLTLEEIRRRRADDRPDSDRGRRGRRPSRSSPSRGPGFPPL